jgi:hypothetical protein
VHLKSANSKKSDLMIVKIYNNESSTFLLNMEFFLDPKNQILLSNFLLNCKFISQELYDKLIIFITKNISIIIKFVRKYRDMNNEEQILKSAIKYPSSRTTNPKQLKTDQLQEELEKFNKRHELMQQDFFKKIKIKIEEENTSKELMSIFKKSGIDCSSEKNNMQGLRDCYRKCQVPLFNEIMAYVTQQLPSILATMT